MNKPQILCIEAGAKVRSKHIEKAIRADKPNQLAFLLDYYHVTTDKDGYINSSVHTAFADAVYDNHIETVHLMLEAGIATLLYDEDEDNDSLLVDSAENNRLDMLLLLLEYGACPSAYGRCGELPLMRAIANDNIEMVKILLAYGADPEKVECPGLHYGCNDQRAIVRARKAGYDEIVDLLRKFYVYETSSDEDDELLPEEEEEVEVRLDDEENEEDELPLDEEDEVEVRLDEEDELPLDDEEELDDDS